MLNNSILIYRINCVDEIKKTLKCTDEIKKNNNSFHKIKKI